MTGDPRRSTSRYRRRRAIFLARNPLCAECKRKDCIEAATELDHIIPIEDGADFWDETNWQALCRPCHEAKTEGERRAGKFDNSRSVPGRDAWRERIGLACNAETSREKDGRPPDKAGP